MNQRFKVISLAPVLGAAPKATRVKKLSVGRSQSG